MEKVTHGWAWQGGPSRCPIYFLCECGNPHSTRALSPAPVTHTHLSLPLKPKVRFRSHSRGPHSMRVPRAEHGTLPARTLRGPGGLLAGPPPSHRGGPLPDLRVFRAPEMFVLHLPVHKAIIGNRIHSPGTVTSSGHRSPGSETLLGPGLTTDTTEGRSAPWHRVTSPRLVSDTGRGDESRGGRTQTRCVCGRFPLRGHPNPGRFYSWQHAETNTVAAEGNQLVAGSPKIKTDFQCHSCLSGGGSRLKI